MKKFKLFLIGLTLMSYSSFAFATKNRPKTNNNTINEIDKKDYIYSNEIENFKLTQEEKEKIDYVVFKNKDVPHQLKQQLIEKIEIKTKEFLKENFCLNNQQKEKTINLKYDEKDPFSEVVLKLNIQKKEEKTIFLIEIEATVRELKKRILQLEKTVILTNEEDEEEKKEQEEKDEEEKEKNFSYDAAEKFEKWFNENNKHFNKADVKFHSFLGAFIKKIEKNKNEILNLKQEEELKILMPMPKYLVKNKDLYALICTITKKNKNKYFLTKIEGLKNNNNDGFYNFYHKLKNFDYEIQAKLEEWFYKNNENFNQNSEEYKLLKNEFVKEIKKYKFKIAEIKEAQELNIILKVPKNLIKNEDVYALKFKITRIPKEYELDSITSLNISNTINYYNKLEQNFNEFKLINQKTLSKLEDWFCKNDENFKQPDNAYAFFKDAFKKEVKKNKIKLMALKENQETKIVVPFKENENEDVFKLILTITKKDNNFNLTEINPLKISHEFKETEKEKNTKSETEQEKIFKELKKQFTQFLRLSLINISNNEFKRILEIFELQLKLKDTVNKIIKNKENKDYGKTEVLEIITEKKEDKTQYHIIFRIQTTPFLDTTFISTDRIYSPSNQEIPLLNSSKELVFKNQLNFLNNNYIKPQNQEEQEILKNLEFNDSKLKCSINQITKKEIDAIKKDYYNKLQQNLEKIKILREHQPLILTLNKPKSLENSEDLYSTLCEIKAIIKKQQANLTLNISPWIPNNKLKQFLKNQVENELIRNNYFVELPLNNVLEKITQEILKYYNSEQGTIALKENLNEAEKLNVSSLMKMDDGENYYNCYAYFIKDKIKCNCPFVVIKGTKICGEKATNIPINFNNPFLNVLKGKRSIKNFNFNENEKQDLLKYFKNLAINKQPLEALIKNLKNVIKKILFKKSFNELAKKPITKTIKNLKTINFNLTNNKALKFTIKVNEVDPFHKEIPNSFKDEKTYILKIYIKIINNNSYETNKNNIKIKNSNIKMNKKTKRLEVINPFEKIIMLDVRFILNNKEFTKKQINFLVDYFKNISKTNYRLKNEELELIHNEILKNLKTLAPGQIKVFDVNFYFKQTKKKYKIKFKAEKTLKGYYCYNFFLDNNKKPLIETVDN